jgi:hypothetical protein
MSDIFLDILRAILGGIIFYALLFKQMAERAYKHKGWMFILLGFGLIFFGMLIDITDNFPELNKYIIIGDTEYQGFTEKVVGYLFGFCLVSIGLWKWLPSISELEISKKKLETTLNELRAAHDKVKILSGLILICSYCKKIRDDKGYWNQIESYIRDHSEAEFSHGICPECVNKIYPNFYKDKDRIY